MTPLRTLVAGLGTMGQSHALAYHADPAFEIVGLVNRSAPDLPEPSCRDYPLDGRLPRRARPATSPTSSRSPPTPTATPTTPWRRWRPAPTSSSRSRSPPPSPTPSASRRRPSETGAKVVVGYILRHHPSWQRLIAESRALGGPYVFRLNLNQQSSGPTWETHKRADADHLADRRLRRPLCRRDVPDHRRRAGRGPRHGPAPLRRDRAQTMYNYGHFQVLFADGSLGWYEAGWGPMMSDTAFFVKDVVSPNGAVSIRMPESARSDDIDTHTKTSALRIHRDRPARSGPRHGRRARPPGALRPPGRLRRPRDRRRTPTSPATSRTPSPRSPSASPPTRAFAPASP